MGGCCFGFPTHTTRATFVVECGWPLRGVLAVGGCGGGGGGGSRVGCGCLSGGNRLGLGLGHGCGLGLRLGGGLRRGLGFRLLGLFGGGGLLGRRGLRDGLVGRLRLGRRLLSDWLRG